MWDQGKSSRYPRVPNNQGLGKCMRKKWLELCIDSVFYPYYLRCLCSRYSSSTACKQYIPSLEQNWFLFLIIIECVSLLSVIENPFLWSVSCSHWWPSCTAIDFSDSFRMHILLGRKLLCCYWLKLFSLDSQGLHCGQFKARCFLCSHHL